MNSSYPRRFAVFALIMALIAVAAVAADAPARLMAPVIAVSQTAGPAPMFQKCVGPAQSVAPHATFNLTCNVVSSLGGSQMFVVPEMWTPGNGCIVTADKPRVVMQGNNFAVSATMTNRCGGANNGTEGGLGWFIYQVQ